MILKVMSAMLTLMVMLLMLAVICGGAGADDDHVGGDEWEAVNNGDGHDSFAGHMMTVEMRVVAVSWLLRVYC